jgi:hypothetical protein
MVAVREARSIVGTLWPQAWREPGTQKASKGVSLMVDEKI